MDAREHQKSSLGTNASEPQQTSPIHHKWESYERNPLQGLMNPKGLSVRDVRSTSGCMQRTPHHGHWYRSCRDRFIMMEGSREGSLQLIESTTLSNIEVSNHAGKTVATSTEFKIHEVWAMPCKDTAGLWSYNIITTADRELSQIMT